MLYSDVMSERLVGMMRQLIVKEGSAGKSKLALAARRGERMIDRYMKGQAFPSSDTAFRLALACGATESEALALAGEASKEARETA
jgi:transcriptional regulator with XRE-family HTH domain